MTKDLVPWVTKTFATTGSEQNWLLGFSKSGLGAQDLLLKHPDLFTEAASWDFPADMSSYGQFGASSVDAVRYGRQLPVELSADGQLPECAQGAVHGREPSIWIGGYDDFQTDVSDYDTLLTSEGIEHTTETPLKMMPHDWGSPWVPLALTALSADGAALPAGP